VSMAVVTRRPIYPEVRAAISVCPSALFRFPASRFPCIFRKRLSSALPSLAPRFDRPQTPTLIIVFLTFPSHFGEQPILPRPPCPAVFASKAVGFDWGYTLGDS
jgi:hypothetical protein